MVSGPALAELLGAESVKAAPVFDLVYVDVYVDVTACPAEIVSELTSLRWRVDSRCAISSVYTLATINIAVVVIATWDEVAVAFSAL